MIGQEEFYMEIRKKWKSLYPAYFDKSKSIAEGRRVPATLAVDSPNIQQLIVALTQTQVKFIVEQHKSYPRGWNNVGRFKVQVLGDKKQAVNPRITNKNVLLKAVGQRLVENRKARK